MDYSDTEQQADDMIGGYTPQKQFSEEDVLAMMRQVDAKKKLVLPASNNGKTLSVNEKIAKAATRGQPSNTTNAIKKEANIPSSRTLPSLADLKKGPVNPKSTVPSLPMIIPKTKNSQKIEQVAALEQEQQNFDFLNEEGTNEGMDIEHEEGGEDEEEKIDEAELLKQKIAELEKTLSKKSKTSAVKGNTQIKKAQNSTTASDDFDVKQEESEEEHKAAPKAEASKKIKKAAKVYKKSVQIVDLGTVKALERSSNNRRKFKIPLKYVGEDEKTHGATIKFGDHERVDFFQDKNEARRLGYVNRIGNTDNPLHQNFWNARLLNHHSGNLKFAFEEIKKSFGLGIEDLPVYVAPPNPVQSVTNKIHGQASIQFRAKNPNPFKKALGIKQEIKEEDFS